MNELPPLDDIALATWMDSQGLGEGDITAIRRLGGGTQNVMLRFRRGDCEYVLRRPPEHPRPTSTKSLLREMRVVAALSRTDVPHPRFLAGCPDPTVLGEVFYLMEPVEGFNPRELLPPRHAADPALRRALSLEVVDAAARLGAVDHTQLGLADLGRPEGFLERQVPRWLRELHGYADTPGYPGPQLPGSRRIAAWLDDNRPRSWRPGLMHGDLHFGNVMISWDGPQVVAVIDWEMATIGDPLLDLGWLLATWPRGPEDAEDGPIATAGALATLDEAAERYRRRSPRNIDAVGWYAVLACFKLGILVEGTYARACAGHADPVVGDRLHRKAIRLFHRALAYIAAS